MRTPPPPFVFSYSHFGRWTLLNGGFENLLRVPIVKKAVDLALKHGYHPPEQRFLAYNFQIFPDLITILSAWSVTDCIYYNNWRLLIGQLIPADFEEKKNGLNSKNKGFTERSQLDFRTLIRLRDILDASKFAVQYLHLPMNSKIVISCKNLSIFKFYWCPASSK